ncbi:secreted ookinete protein, putative [Plasmodium malariae]|uniref:Secreted ookinete protein, putative n=1 Tax=Plasmodium malariae TaxID=5858 RepID=A0A1A8WXX7_PLAMA|nr:secreted ookinete protein, putative [Plasmodium malariae]SBS96242.1 hypothetical protein PMALA_052250 [Plasmodium malariae]SCO92933.1 secreted ookinete protein, putative [Plasmodium malariae]
MGKFKLLATFFCCLSVCFPVLYRGQLHDKKINLKIELVDKDLLLSNEHLKKEKIIIQNGKKIKIKTFEKIKENVLERALIVQEIDKLKGINDVQKKKEDISLGHLSDDETDVNEDVNADANVDNTEDDSGETQNDIQGEQENYREDGNNMKVISSEESTENDIHMVRKVYQKNSKGRFTTYCYMRYTFNLNLEKLNENNKSELFKGLDKTLDYISFLPKDEKISNTESILDKEYRKLDKQMESAESIISNVQLTNSSPILYSNYSEYIETIDDIINYIDSISHVLNIHKSLKNKLVDEKEKLIMYEQSEGNGNMRKDNSSMHNAPLYELLENLNNSFMMKKKVIYLLQDKKHEESYNKILENNMDDLFISSVRQVFYCYDLLKRDNVLESFFPDKVGEAESEEAKAQIDTEAEEVRSANKEVDIKNHTFNYSPRGTSNDNSVENIDDNGKCTLFFKAILQNQIFADDYSVGLKYMVNENFNIGRETWYENEKKEKTEVQNSGYENSFYNTSNLPMSESNLKVSQNISNDSGTIAHGDKLYSNGDEALDLSHLQTNKGHLEDTASFTQVLSGAKNDEMPDDDNDDAGDYIDENDMDYMEDEDYEDDEENVEDDNEYEDYDENDDEHEDYDEDDVENKYESYDENDDEYEDYDENDDEYEDYDENDDEYEDYDENDDEYEDYVENDEENDDGELSGVKNLLSSLVKKGTNNLIDSATNKVSRSINKKFNLDKLSKKGNKFIDKIKKVTKKSIDKYKKAKKGAYKVKEKGKKYANKALEVVEDSKNAIKKSAKNAMNKTKIKAKKGSYIIKKKGEHIADKAVKAARKSSDKFKGRLKNDTGKLKSGTKKVIDKSKKKANKGADKIKEKGKSVIDKAVKSAKESTDKVKNSLTNGIDKVKNNVSSGTDKVKNSVTNGIDKVKNNVSSGIDKAKNNVTSATNKVINGVTDGINKTKNNFTNGIDKGVKEMKKSIEGVTSKTARTINEKNNEFNKDLNNKKKSLKKNDSASRVKSIGPLGKKVSTDKSSLLSMSDDSNETNLNKKEIKHEIKKINKEFKKLKRMERKIKEELKNPAPSDNKIIEQFDEFEKINEQGKK